MVLRRVLMVLFFLVLLVLSSRPLRVAGTARAPEVTASTWRSMLTQEERALLAPDGRAAVLAWLGTETRRGARAAARRRRRRSAALLLRPPGLRLRLRRATQSVVAPSFVLVHRHGDSGVRLSPDAARLQRREQRFFYEGVAGGNGEWRASLRMRSGDAHGMLTAPSGRLLAVRPLPSRFSSLGAVERPHLLVSMGDSSMISPSVAALSPFNGVLQSNRTDDFLLVKNAPAVRVRRSVAGLATLEDETEDASLPPAVVETAVFVDRDLYHVLAQRREVDPERELMRFVLTLVNAVQLLYHDPSLGRSVNFALKRLEILHSEPTGLGRHRDIDRFLSSFCAWQHALNPATDDDQVHWDHALMLTGLDLYVVGKTGKVSSQVVGLAPVAGMCTTTSSCTVNEGRHFESVYVVAHEIGHNLGMRHDGPLAGNACDPGSFIMSPTLGRGKTTWSSCSRRYLQQFLGTSQARCLLDGGSSLDGLDHGGDGLLPGQRFSITQQCVLKYGPGSTHAVQQPMEDVCRDLHCQRGRRVWTSHPALEGSTCGPGGRWCRRGRCEPRGHLSHARPGQRVDGAWSPWTPFGDCASGCLSPAAGHAEPASTGIMVATRRCNNPRPENGGRSCPGPDRRFRTCHAEQCANIQQTTVLEFADQVCRRAREVDPHLLGTGLQRSSSDPMEACSVWCYKKSGGSVSRGWTFPDGTACQAHHSPHANRPTYCIGGRCEEFTCDRDGSATFGLPPAECAQSGGMSGGRGKGRRRDADAHVPEGCYSGCVAPGRGLRVVASAPGSRQRHTLRLCEPDHLECGRMRTPFEYATTICSGLRDRVQRLSGLGMQLSAAAYDPDRPCRVACQDADLPRRFYLVNGEIGWFPPGTDCGRGERQAYCVSGICLDFGIDGSLDADLEFAIPLLNRTRREVWNNHKTIPDGAETSVTSPVDISNSLKADYDLYRTSSTWNSYLERYGVR